MEKNYHSQFSIYKDQKLESIMHCIVAFLFILLFLMPLKISNTLVISKEATGIGFIRSVPSIRVGHPGSASGQTLNGDGIKDDYPYFNALLSEISTNDFELVITQGSYLLNYSLVVPANVHLRFEKGGAFKLASGQTLTINGTVEAGYYQLFSGSGTVTFGSKVTTVYPEWWGAVYGDSNDNSVAVQAAMNSLPSGTVQFNGMVAVGRTSWTGLTLASKSNIKLVGANKGCGIKVLAQPTQTIPTFPNSYTLIKMTSCSYLTISNVEINGNSLSFAFLGMEFCSYCIIEDNYFHDTVVTAGNRNTRAIMARKGSHNKYMRNKVYKAAGGFLLGNTNSDPEVDLMVSNNNLDTVADDGLAGTWQMALIEGNRFYNISYSGVVNGSWNGTQSKDVKVINNYIHGCGWHGIQSDAMDESDPNLNWIIQGNTICCGAQSGIYIAGPAQNWIIQGNVIYDNNYDGRYYAAGICIDCVYPTLGSYMKDIVIADNLIYNSAGKQKWGIILNSRDTSDRITKITIRGNTIYGNVSHGIFLTRYSTGTMNRISLVGNRVYNNGFRGIEVDAGVSNLVVVGNQSYGNKTNDMILNSAIPIGGPAW
jgi:Right handed beta helix region